MTRLQKTSGWLLAAGFVASCSLGSNSALASFEWGADCDSGEGSFSQGIAYRDDVHVGVIPAGKRDVEILLTSDRDVDVQLIDVETGDRIIHWPYGLLDGPDEECTQYKGATYCYSGYNGDGRNLGHEWIRVNGNTNRDVEMRAYGYEAGSANITYRFSPTPSCQEKGNGSFSQYIAEGGVTTIGTIPAGKVDVDISLTALNDLDVQLFAGDTAIVQWPYGLLNGPTEQHIDFQNMSITWSGYNGDGTNLGNEFIRIRGEVTTDLVMKAYGYEAGTAKVDYEWGIHSGDMCGGIAGFQCADGWTCKGMPNYPDAAGWCHLDNWCSAETYEADCAAYGANMRLVPGEWACETFQCVYHPYGDDICEAPAGYMDGTADIINDPEEYAGEPTALTGTLELGPAYCTRMACSVDNPCCNSCGAGFKLNVPGGQVELDIGCSGNECTYMDNCPYDDGETVTVWGEGQVLFGAASLDVEDSCSVSATTCASDADCGDGYCAANGQCEAHGSCNVDADCTNDANEWDDGIFCIATTTWHAGCEQGTCEVQCLPINLPMCEDVGDIDFGLCEMLLGYAPVNGQCQAVSGCSNQGMNFYATQAECESVCY